jgi:TonB-dependent SusC/RagA subfamily outer membrane receptor
MNGIRGRGPTASRAIVASFLLGLCGACASPMTERDADEYPPARGSGSRIDAEEISRLYPSAATVEEILVRHFPGVALRTTREGGVATTSVQILGMGQPLFVIDGVPLQITGSLPVNPRDVESIEILKDASTSLYGVRGANGVIVIATKR